MTDESSEGLEASNALTYASPQILNVSPLDLYFPPPHNRDLSCTMTLVNSTKEPVAFKVKTTAPRRYVVRPPQGLCPPGQSVQVTVALNYAKDPPNDKSQDKFQIQAFAVKNHLQQSLNSTDDLKALWSNAPKSQIVKTKVRSFFTDDPKGASLGSTATATTSVTPAANTAASATTAVGSKGGKVEEVSKVIETSHSAKPRVASTTTPVHASFDNYIDPVSNTSAVVIKTNSMVPMALIAAVAILLGIILGMYLERLTGESCPTIVLPPPVIPK